MIRKRARKRGETMSHRGDLDQILHLLRCYHTAVHATQAGMQQIRSPEQLTRLEQRLNVAYAAKARLEEELGQFLTDLQVVLVSGAKYLKAGRKTLQSKRTLKLLRFCSSRLPLFLGCLLFLRADDLGLSDMAHIAG